MKTAVITGGAGGLGQAMARGLQAAGWHTALIDLPGGDLAGLAQTAAQSLWACDLTDGAQVEATANAIRTARPSIDLLICNAGITHIGLFADSQVTAHRRVFEVNYFAAVAITKAFLTDIRAARGTHLAISSVAGFTPLYKRTAYAASKHALEGFFTSLRAEESAYGVTTLIAAPSFVATNPGARPDAGGTLRPGAAADGVDHLDADQAAAIILKGLAGRRQMIPVGRVAWLAWVLNRVSPRLYARLMLRSMTKDQK